MLGCHPALPESGRGCTLPRPAKRQKVKVAKTSVSTPESNILAGHIHFHSKFDHGRNPEVREYMDKKMLHLVQMSRDFYVAKMQYQRLRMRELEMMKVIIRDELEETQGYLNQT